MFKKSQIGWFFVLILIFSSFSDYLFNAKLENSDRLIPQILRAFFFFIMLVFITVFRSRIKSDKNKILKGVNLLFFVIIVLPIFNLNYLVDNYFSFFKVIYGLVSFYFFYYAIKTNYLKLYHFNVLIISITLIYFFSILKDSNDSNLFFGSKDYFVSNYSYHLLKLFPLVVFVKSKYRNILICLIVSGIIISLKRGPLLAISICLAIYFTKLIFDNQSKIITRVIILCSFLLLMNSIIKKYLEKIIIRTDDISSINTFGSGRIVLYEIIYDHMINSSLLVLLLGNGFFSTIDLYEKTIGHSITAHSDFFEMFYDFGVIGLFSLILFYYFIFLQKKYLTKYAKNSLIYWLIVNLSASFYSINIFSAEMIYSMISLALISHFSSNNFNVKHIKDENLDWW